MARQVVFVASEMYPFSKSGGLGDVMGALPPTLARMGVPTAVITPFYGRLRTGESQLKLTMENCPVGYPWAPITVDVFETTYKGVTVYFLHRGEYFDRRHYYNDHKGDYFDNAERFIYFCRAAFAFMRAQGERTEEAPAVVHVHDWQTALLPALIHFARETDPFWAATKSLITIHNIAFQGRYSSRLFDGCGLPPEAWHMDGAEYYGDFNLLKTGIAYADLVSTVSPSYAREILTERFGFGLDGILRHREHELAGILNGTDYGIWDPRTDRYITERFSRQSIMGKATCKRSLIKELGLSPHLEDKPLLGFIGRLRGQKGIDLLIDILPQLMERDLGVIVLGEGNPRFEHTLLQMMEQYKGRLHAAVTYTEDLAHRIQAGSDCFLMPSRYEPCGLTQMYALRYGTPPIATAAGGLRDSIIPYPHPKSTGFMFPNSDKEAFLATILQAVDLWENDPEAWQDLVRRAMSQAFTWDRSARQYVELYRQLGWNE